MSVELSAHSARKSTLNLDGRPIPLRHGARTLEVVGERWTLLIVRDLFMGIQRFSDLVAHLDIPRAILSARLTALEDEGIVERRPYSATRHEFVLTQAGRELWPSVYALTQWGERHRCAGGGARRLWLHAACGSELDDAGACPACGVTPVPEAVETRLGTVATGRRARTR